MRCNRLFLSSAILVAGAVGVQAQSWEGVATLSFGSGEIEDSDYDVFGLALRGDVDFGNGVEIETSLDFNRLDADGGSDLDMTSFAFAPTYGFGGGYKIGAYLSRNRLSAGGENVTFDSFGGLAGFEIGGYDFEAFYGTTDEDPEIPGDEDWTDYGFNVHYAMNPALTLGGGYGRTEIEVGGDTSSINLVGLAAAYDFGDVNLFGGYVRSALGDDFVGEDVEARTVGLGVGYDLSAVTGYGATASLELVRGTSEIGDFDIDSKEIRVGLSVPLGGASATVPQGSIAATVLNGPRSALGGGTVMLFGF